MGVSLGPKTGEFFGKLIKARAKEMSKNSGDEDSLAVFEEALEIKLQSVLDDIGRKAYAKGEIDGYNSCDCW